MKWTRTLGYGAFFFCFFIVGLYLTFPWQIAKDRILKQVETKSGLHLTAKSLEPSWLTGVRLEELELVLKPGAAPIKLDWLVARLKLLPLLTGKLGGTVRAPLGKGQIEAGVVSGSETLLVEATVDAVQLDQVGFLQEMSGLPLHGQIDLELDLSLGLKDPKLTEGSFKLKTTGLGVEKGGKLGMIPVPNLELGNLTLDFPIKEGKAEFKKARLPGTDLELLLDGSLSPQVPFGKTAMNLVLGLKPTEKLLGSDPLLRPILRNFEQYKDGEGFYGVALTGTVQFLRKEPRRP